MDTNLIYMPTFRVRQQEALVLRSFDFGANMYPLLEIVKEHDRARGEGAQLPFEQIYLDLIRSVRARHVFVDLPNYLKPSGSMKDEVVSFVRTATEHLEDRIEYVLRLSAESDKIIPVIPSYLIKTGETNSIGRQFLALTDHFSRLAYRISPLSFREDFQEVRDLARAQDFVIIDMDTIAPYPKSPPLRPIVAELSRFNTCCKVLLRSAINTEIQNVKLEHGQVVFEADNSQIDFDTMADFGVNAAGDYVGIKKDDLTAGGTISPGFVYYDAVENQFYGYRADIKKLEQFEDKIVPDILASEATERMLSASPPYLTAQNWGYNTLLNINVGAESGKSQAKFKRIAMQHYLYCMLVKIQKSELRQTNVHPL